MAGDASQSYVTDFSFNTPGTPQKITKTINIPASVITNTTNGRGFIVIIGAIAEATYATSTTDSWVSGTYDSSLARTNWMNTVGNYISITGVQLEIGDAATDFEFRSFAEELALCQRYYEKSFSTWTVPSDSGGAFSYLNVIFKALKRTIPTVTAPTVAGSPVNIDSGYVGTDKFRVSTNATVTDFTWTADAEL